MRGTLLGAWFFSGLLSVALGQPLSLSLAIHTALHHHPSIQRARHAIDRDTQAVEESSAANLPQAQGTAAYDRSTANFALTPGSLPTSLLSSAGDGATHESANSFSAGLSIQQLVYDFGKTPSAIQARQAQVEVSRSEAVSTRLHVVFEVTQAFFLALQAQELLTVQQQTQEQYQEHLAQAKEFFRVGSRPKFDVLKAEVDLANSQVNLLKAVNAVKNTRRKLQFTMGIRDALTDTLDPSVLSPTPLTLRLPDLMDQASLRRPDLLTARARLQLADAEKTASTAGEAPTVLAGGSYSWQGQAFPLVWNWSLGLNLTWPLFTGYAARAATAQAEANLHIAKAREEETLQSAYLELEQHFNDMRGARERIDATDKLIDQAKEQLSLAENRYTTGVGSPVEVTDAQVALTNAKTSRVQALVEFKISEAKLLQSAGALLPEEPARP